MRIKGEAVNIYHPFVKELEIKAENELEARIKVTDILKDRELKNCEFIIDPASEGSLYPYTQGSEFGLCTIEVTKLY
ncbi:hypothetical protein EQO05_00185 [Methanosarcina sp. MSH10X1]|nr:hypothetical protein EQO05_00185 [Methanosarcina sp. MSH10X1]